ncbi:MAG: uracil-DNA glycosylase [Candidatus Paceibacterota bacterium]
MEAMIEASWRKELKNEFDTSYFKKLTADIAEEYRTATIYPSKENLFTAFELCPFNSVKVVILGQDPYHGPKQAIGLSFAIGTAVRLPPSLRNIFKEIQADTGTQGKYTNGDLSRWAKQGVLLLNSTLTVRAGEPGSHQNKGWELFTDAVTTALSQKREHLVFMLWGNSAKNKGAHVDSSKHLVLQSPHPSPFSAHSGFFGCKHFSKANAYLEAHAISKIDWS